MNYDIVWFENLYIKNSARMYKHAARLLGNEWIAEEIVHDVFTMVIIKYDIVKSHPNPDAWLIYTLNRMIHTELKRAKYHMETPLEDDTFAHIKPTDKVTNYLPKGLSEQERHLFIWKIDEGLSYSDIASILKVSESVCRLRFFRAKEHCKKILEKNMSNYETKQRSQVINILEEGIDD